MGHQRLHGQFDEQAVRQRGLANLFKGKHQVLAIATDGRDVLTLYGADLCRRTLRVQGTCVDQFAQGCRDDHIIGFERQTTAGAIAQGIDE